MNGFPRRLRRPHREVKAAAAAVNGFPGSNYLPLLVLLGMHVLVRSFVRLAFHVPSKPAVALAVGWPWRRNGLSLIDDVDSITDSSSLAARSSYMCSLPPPPFSSFPSMQILELSTTVETQSKA